MKNYRDQTPKFRCAACNLCYCREEHDEYPEYFCTDGAEARPIATLHELLEAGLKISERDYDAWEKWARENRVSENGICEHYEACSIPLDQIGIDVIEENFRKLLA